ncbi:MAG: DUF1015 domain-containing protein [Ruthenibacterium sp.]
MDSVFKAAEILLPAETVALQTWPTLACDQFTSQPEYWQKAEALCEHMPSTLHITLPEAYLTDANVAARIAEIHETMHLYAENVLTKTICGFIYVERKTQSGVRQGLVGAVDLEAYSYEKSAALPIRPSENTVVERIPPRLAVRRDALLEAPHILMMLDDAAHTVLEPLGVQAHAETLTQLYATDLMLGGGQITGWAVTDAAQIAAIEAQIAAFAAQDAFDARYPAAKGTPPIALAVGDGNHSLATAKAYWEEIKVTLSPQAQRTHPARFALAELVNVHSDAIQIEPIHRAVFGTDSDSFSSAFTAWLLAKKAQLFDKKSAEQTFTLVGTHDESFAVSAPPCPLAVGTLEAFLADFCAEHPAVTVDYIHDEAALRTICRAPNTVGVLLPPFAKSDLFRGVVLGGVLPKKTFSMGTATEKRYYLECRKISL